MEAASSRHFLAPYRLSNHGGYSVIFNGAYLLLMIDVVPIASRWHDVV